MLYVLPGQYVVINWINFSSVVVQLLSCIWLFATPWTEAHQGSLSFTISWNLLKIMSIESVMPSNFLILCHPLLLLPSIFCSMRVFSNELALHIRWPKYWIFSFSNSLFSEYSGMISFRIHWFDLLASEESQEFQESSPASQFKSTSSSVLSFLYGPTLTSVHESWKIHRFDHTAFVGKVTALVLDTLSRFVIAFLPRSNCLLI